MNTCDTSRNEYTLAELNSTCVNFSIFVVSSNDMQ